MAARVLLFGGGGKMGSAVRRLFSPRYEVLTPDSREFDARRREGLGALLDRHAPELVVNAAGFLGIDACERDPGTAFEVNALFPRDLARLCGERGIDLAHFSTDAVFRGDRDGFYDEGDEPLPINVYGATKLAGEQFIRAHGGRHYILRLSVLFGPSPKGGQFVERMVARALAGEPLRIADDVVASPTYSIDVARRLLEMVEAGGGHGLHHCANQGRGTLFELISEALRMLGLDAQPQRASHLEFGGTQQKCLRTAITTTRMAPLRPWREALAEYCAELAARGEGGGAAGGGP